MDLRDFKGKNWETVSGNKCKAEEESTVRLPGCGSSVSGDAPFARLENTDSWVEDRDNERRVFVFVLF